MPQPREAMVYARPTGLDDALRLMAERPWTVLAGGTDLYPATTAQQLPGDILDIGGLGLLRGVTETPTHWRIGGRTSWTDVLRADLPPAFDALKLAAREVGSVQIQNAGTVAGNLCNASPAADGVPALLVLDAEVELSTAAGRRTLPLAAFLTGPRRTARRADELLTAVSVPKGSAAGRSTFLKLGARKYLVISIAMTAARLVVRSGRVTEAAVAVGACSATARRISTVEAALVGRPADTMLPQAVRDADVAACLSPIDDVRGSADYRARAAAELIRRTLVQVVG
jgi:CO/xanthine dehydrogenase FAD-binding subunit